MRLAVCQKNRYAQNDHTPNKLGTVIHSNVLIAVKMATEQARTADPKIVNSAFLCLLLSDENNSEILFFNRQPLINNRNPSINISTVKKPRKTVQDLTKPIPAPRRTSFSKSVANTIPIEMYKAGLCRLSPPCFTNSFESSTLNQSQMMTTSAENMQSRDTPKKNCEPASGNNPVIPQWSIIRSSSAKKVDTVSKMTMALIAQLRCWWLLCWWENVGKNIVAKLKQPHASNAE